MEIIFYEHRVYESVDDECHVYESVDDDASHNLSGKKVSGS